MPILIIEDDLLVAELLQRGLEGQGFTTTLDYDGISGKKSRILKLTDIKKPHNIRKPRIHEFYVARG